MIELNCNEALKDQEVQSIQKKVIISCSLDLKKIFLLIKIPVQNDESVAPLINYFLFYCSSLFILKGQSAIGENVTVNFLDCSLSLCL